MWARSPATLAGSRIVCLLCGGVPAAARFTVRRTRILPSITPITPCSAKRPVLGNASAKPTVCRCSKRQGFRESDRILDYGCGAGLFVGILGEKGLKQVFGYDAFVPAYHDPKRLQEQYDAVVSYDVIEHDDDPREFMRRVAPLVRPGGLLAIGTPNADHVSIARKGNPSLHPPYHRHILSERMLLALGREQGLEPVDIYRRSFYDSLFPTVNSRFLWRYLEKSGLLDTAVEPPRTGLILRSPELLFFAFFGYFLPPGDWILVSFRKN